MKFNPKNRRQPKWRKEGESLQEFERRVRKFTEQVIADMVEKKKKANK